MIRSRKHLYRWTLVAATAPVAGTAQAHDSCNFAEQYDVGEVRESVGALHDGTLDPNQPQAMVYARGADGALRRALSTTGTRTSVSAS